MYLRKLTIENIRVLKRLELTFPEPAAGWHVIIGDNGAGKSTLIRAISLGLIGPTEVRAAHPDFSEWLRKGEEAAKVTLDLVRDPKLDRAKNNSRAHHLTAQVLIETHNPLRRLGGEGAPVVEVLPGTHARLDPSQGPWSSQLGWFSVGFGSYRRLTGGDEETNKVYHSSPRCGAHLSVFGENVAFSEALNWLQELDYRIVKARQMKLRQEAHPLNLRNTEAAAENPADDVLQEVKQLWEISVGGKTKCYTRQNKMLANRPA